MNISLKQGIIGINVEKNPDGLKVTFNTKSAQHAQSIVDADLKQQFDTIMYKDNITAQAIGSDIVFTTESFKNVAYIFNKLKEREHVDLAFAEVMRMSPYSI